MHISTYTINNNYDTFDKDFLEVNLKYNLHNLNYQLWCNFYFRTTLSPIKL